MKNNLSHQSEVFIFSDGYKDVQDKKDVLEVRKYLSRIEGFKSIKIIESEKNKGLASSIITGVTDIINRYGKVIVLEDDLIVSDDFLDYMNEALNFYENDKKIWSVAGYGPKLSCLENYSNDIYLAVRGSSWGWATWQNRWDTVDWEVKDFDRLKRSKSLQRKFNLGGNDMYKMLELQVHGKIDSWAIRWCFSQFIQEKYTIYPVKSKVLNEGFGDLKGTHNSGINKKWVTELSNQKIHFKKLKLSEKLVQCFQSFHNLSLKTKIGYFLKKYGGYSFAKRILLSWSK